MTNEMLDQWANWLLHRRHGDDPEELRRTIDRLAVVRDRVLANARLGAGDTLLDVGTGDGLIAFGALDRVGEQGSVIFSDVSRDLLDHDRALTERMGVTGRCRFVQAPAEDLSPVADRSVDVVTTRSVLAYVKDKRRAFAEFARVLRPGGRISLYEPVNRLVYPEPPGRFFGYNVEPVQDLAERIRAADETRQPIASDPMFDYDERDLLRFAAAAGFGERHLELRVDVTPHQPRRWETFAASSPNPLQPPWTDVIDATLTADEAARFVNHLRPLVEGGEGTFAVAVVYVWGIKDLVRYSPDGPDAASTA